MTLRASGINRLHSGRTLALTASVFLHVLGLWAVQRTLSNYLAPEPLQPLVVVMELPERDAAAHKPAPLAPALPSPVPKAVVKAAALPATKGQASTSAAPVPAAPAVAQAAPISGQATAAPVAPVAPSGSDVQTAASGAASSSTAASGPTNGSGGASSVAGRAAFSASELQCLNNTKPEYPPLSRRRGEEGRVVVNVLVSLDGTVEKAEIKVPSGFDRLDQAAIASVKAWRCVPGMRGGVPEVMWFSVPIRFNIE